MKSYLCIGGPLHGELKSLPDGARDLRLPKKEDGFKFYAHPCSPACNGGCCCITSFAPKYETYTVKAIVVGEDRTEPSNNGVMSVRVSVRADIQVLAHESVLTTEELAAWFRKLQPRAIAEGAEKAFVRMDLTR